MITYQTSQYQNQVHAFRELNSSKEPVRKHKCYEFKGHAVKLTQGYKPGEQIVLAHEGDGVLVLNFSFATYKKVSRRRTQIVQTRVVICRQEWLPAGNDFVWVQTQSMEV